jgi:NADH-quinone oxidoreductase subunit H
MDLYHLVVTLITIAVVLGVILGACAYLIYLERKISAYMQDRIGPNRVGPRGLLQPIADGLKFLFKEDIIPDHVDKLLFLAAPAIAMTTALLAFAVVPFGPTTVPEQDPENYKDTYQFVIAPHVNIGLVFIFAITSLTVYAIILGGWSSNNKYSFIGALRSSAQLVSYEIPMGMSVLGIFLLTGSLNLEEIIHRQVESGWNIFLQPLAFLLFLTAAFAECNRLPFDLPEAEQELVGGYHTEYSAMKFAMFFLGEYTHMITTSFLLSVLFLGGWHFPGIQELPGWLGIALMLLVMFIKVTFFILVYMVIRWTIPRFRFDQLMGLAWKVLIPLALANLVAVMVVQQVIAVYHLDLRWQWVLLPVSLVMIVATGLFALKEPHGPERRHIQVGQADDYLEVVPR